MDYYITDPEDDDYEKMEPIQLVEAIGAIKGGNGKSRQVRNDFEPNDRVKRVAAEA